MVRMGMKMVNDSRRGVIMLTTMMGLCLVVMGSGQAVGDERLQWRILHELAFGSRRRLHGQVQGLRCRVRRPRQVAQPEMASWSLSLLRAHSPHEQTGARGIPSSMHVCQGVKVRSWFPESRLNRRIRVLVSESGDQPPRTAQRIPAQETTIRLLEVHAVLRVPPRRFRYREHRSQQRRSGAPRRRHQDR